MKYAKKEKITKWKIGQIRDVHFKSALFYS